MVELHRSGEAMILLVEQLAGQADAEEDRGSKGLKRGYGHFIIA